ncbi:MAG: hypothetical protein EON57_02800 [Alphaproteobacteria bacterium]|nr:MAG: hypothetical protein EON57_02800 [Alphaproteobacteria bacterium]
MAPVVEALQALRGIRLVTAATIMVDVGDLGRFETARQFIGWLWLVPDERSTRPRCSRHRWRMTSDARWL